MECVWKFKFVDKVVEVCVIEGVKWYDVIGVVSRCWSGGEG